MIKYKKILPFTPLLIISLIVVSNSIPADFKLLNSSFDHSLNIIDIIEGIDYNRIKFHVKNFVSFGSRVTGYPGNYLARNYICEEFKKYGLTVINHTFSLAVPIDHGSSITVESPVKQDIPAFALWPNGPQTCLTPPEGLTGRLIYVGNGELENFNGQDIMGSIVLMDFNSGLNWITAASLGAKAIIFSEPDETTHRESLMKSSPIPLYIPRLYIKDGLFFKKLASQNATVTVHSKMRWENITAYNIVAIVNGTIYPNEVIIVAAHYDSWSVVPALAPCADDSLSIASMLELARYFSNPANRPLRSIWFVAFSGYYQGLEGPIEWCEKYLFNEPVQSGKVIIRFVINLDLSSRDSMGVDVLYTGPPSWFGTSTEQVASMFALRYSWIDKKIREYINQVLSKIETKESPENLLTFNYASMWWGTQPILGYTWFYQSLIEPFLTSGILGISIRTQWAYRSTWFTPLNDEPLIIWKNFYPQLIISSAIIKGFVNEEQWNVDYVKPDRIILLYSRMLIGFTTLNGKVVEYNVSEGWYTPVGDALVRLCPSNPNEYLIWPFINRYKFSCSDGSFIFHGIIPWRGGVPHVGQPSSYYTLNAWKFNNTDGSIIYAVDEGIYGLSTGMVGGIISRIYPVAHPTGVMVPIFRCVGVTVFNLMDPKIARSSYLPWTLLPASLNVYDAKTWSFPVFYGRDVALAYNLGTVFVQKGTNIVITFNPNLQRATRDLIILSNSTNDNPEGYGYSVNEPLIIYNTLYHAVKDMHYLCVNRYSSLKEKNIRNVAAEVFIEQAESYISKAEDYLKNKIYDKFYDTCLVALALTSRAYDESVMPLFDELSRFLLFFTIPMLLFAIFFERFIFHMQKMKRIIGIAIILILLILTLNYVNPIFKLMANSIMAFFGTSLILLAVVIITIFIKEAIDIMESTVVRLLGEHEVKTEKVSALLYSLGVAVDNMRRRPLTTILTLMTIITFNAAITTFTSASVVVSVLETPPKTVQIPYNGLLLKKDYAIPPDVRGGVLDLPLISYMKGIAGEGYYIVPRVWYYPLSIYPYGPSLVIVSKGVSYIISPSALLGLSSEESALLFDKYIINGSATLFSLRGCIISNNLAKMLNVKVGEQIELKGTGINFTITGIVETFGERLTDFDSRSILPIDPFYSSTLARMSIPYSETLEPQPLSLDNVIIVYWKTAYELGGYVSSVSLIPKSNITFEDLKDVGRRAALGNDVIFYAGYNNSVVSFYRTTTYLTFGWEVLIVLIAISSLSIFNTLIGNIERRKPEIRIFASLGLSPLGAGIMFIAESLAYAVLASVIGYLIGYAMNIILTRFMLIGFPLNASSLFITISLLVVLITCLGSSIYPFIVASKLITPSLERKWKLATKPHGDYWAISLPVSFPTREIGYGLLAFLEEYYTGMGAVRPGFMVRGISPFNASEESIMLEITLTPAELNLNMTVTFKVIPHGNTFSLEMLMERKSGDYKQWIIRSYYFIDSVRKQILVWGTLSEGEKLIYINKNKE